MTDLIRATGLTKRYDHGFTLSDVSLTVPAGSVVGFVGANGAGKTTTIRALLGLTRLDAGDVVLFGEPFSLDADNATAQRVKSRIGVVLDTCPFVGELPIATTGNIMASAYPSWKQDLFENFLRQFNLEPKKRVSALSRGMGMKLQIACALAHEPDLLILDEATAGLDPIARDEILDILRECMADGKRGILLSSHITSDLEKIADSIVCIDEGHIMFDVEKDVITDEAGIARCRANEFEEVAESGVFAPGTLRYLRREFGVDLLVPDRFAFARAFPHIVCERISIDDYLNLSLKGETR